MKKLILFILFQTFLFANSSILVINSYHKGYEFSDNIINGLESVLYKNSDIDVNILYMDSKRITSKDYYNNLEKLYEIQLKNRKYDLVVAVDRFAYDFVLDIYSKFFTTEPILAVGIENFSKEKAKRYGLEDRISALLEKRDLEENLNVIKKLMPQIKKLYIINDKSINALHTEPLINNLIKKFHNKYNLVYLKEDNLELLKKRFSQNELNSVALFIRFYKNKNGELNKNSEIAKFIKNAKIPIFITDSIFIKKGATGGKIVDLYRFGKSSANMALEILDNKPPKVVVSSDLHYIFDAEKLEEFTLPVDAISEDFEIVNKRETFYDRHSGFINFVFTISPFLIFLILGLAKNIYMRKRVEKDLRKRIEFDEVLLNAIENPIFREDNKGIVVDTNYTFCKLLNLDCKNLIGKKLEDFKENKNVNKVIEVLNKYKENQKENFEFSYIDETNAKKTYFVKQEKYRDKKSNKVGLVTIFTDITKEREITLEKQKNRQFIIQQSKLAEIGEVFSSIAHQWKSPLVEITTIAQEIFYTNKAKNAKEDEGFVKDIMQQVTYMTNTINDFQKFIMPSNKKVFFDIKDAIEEMLKIINHNMKYNNIKINLELKNGTKSELKGYKNEFMQSLLNILNNAKDALLTNDYKNRKIDIRVFNDKNDLLIEIEDNGGGIKSENIDKIFEPYYTTKNDGHGIGLYMTKMIIEDKMNGNLYVTNENFGAKFTIELPLIN